MSNNKKLHKQIDDLRFGVNVNVPIFIENPEIYIEDVFGKIPINKIIKKKILKSS